MRRRSVAKTRLTCAASATWSAQTGIARRSTVRIHPAMAGSVIRFLVLYSDLATRYSSNASPLGFPLAGPSRVESGL